MKTEIIIERVEAVAKKKFGKDFSFRPGQKEAIIDILDSYYNSDVETYILEAPTGSGKSLIAMICSAVLEEEKRKGYILTSELALQDQYANDFARYGLKWGHVKGADTYMCAVNFQPFSHGDCRLQKLSYDQAEKLDCFPMCGYLGNRKRSIESPVSLLNNSYALIQRNYVEDQVQKRGGETPFPQRDFVFCDEAHRIISIVQGHFAPRINQELIDSVKYLDTFQAKNGHGSNQLAPQINSVMFLLENENDKAKIFELLKRLYGFMGEQKKKDRMTVEDAGKQFENWAAIPMDWKRALKCCDFTKDVACKIEDFGKIIELVGHDKLVKTVNPTIKDTNEVVFNCVDEGYMVDRYFSQKFGFKVLMSATIGNPKYFMTAMGSKNVRFNRIKSHFNFDKSPIYFMPKNRISYKNIEEKTPELARYITNILRKHDSSGIIHSGSYSLAKRVYGYLPADLRRRVVLYEGSSEKMAALDRLSDEKSNVIVMGPSLLEGIDLKDDLSRLQIFLKVPYPSLGSNFVKEKMNHYPMWYKWAAEIAIEQGVGRSVRSMDDYCVTYFLDGCLQDLLREPMAFNATFRERIQIIDTI